MNTSHPSPIQADADALPACIGVFDSGVGGLSVLRALRQRLPNTSMVYVGDVSHAPYGERAAAEVVERCALIVQHLVDRGTCLIVVACNTATVLGIEALRQRWPNLTFVGVEPGAKPAAAGSRNRRIAVMATPATAASARLRHLIERYATHVQVQVHVEPCPGLAGAIERGVLQGPALLEILRPCCDGVRAANADTVVLGCTHYPFVAGPIQSLLGASITLIDTASDIAKRVTSLWHHAPEIDAPASVRAMSTGTSETMELLLLQCPGLETTEVERLAL